MANSKTKALLIYSEDDQLCKKCHYDLLRSGLEGKENVRFILESRKGHNPNYTEEAVVLLGEFGGARTKFAKKKNATETDKKQFVAAFEWDKMTEQDDALWKEIFDHLDK